MATDTNWYVITGGPSSGKTTLVDMLKARGYATAEEHARHYIDTERVSGRSVEEIRANQIEFQKKVLGMQLAHEKALNPDDTVFLDRAVPDALAYCRYLGIPPFPILLEETSKSPYKKVFILDPLPLAPDYARTEDAVAQKEIHRLIAETYESLPTPVVRVPVMSPEERVAFVLANL